LAAKIEEPVDKVKQAIQEMKEVFIVLDHTRTILICISDGCLPSNVGGGSNVRNILRRCFFILKKNGWWEKLGMEGFIDIFEHHKLDLEGIYGKFPEYKSFAEIINVEYDRWLHTDSAQTVNLEKLIKKNKGKLSIKEWI
jgi:alanyl-tRNA synthetase